MKFFVLGYDDTRLIFMTSKVFESQESAEAYAKRCNPGWKAFVVGEV